MLPLLGSLRFRLTAVMGAGIACFLVAMATNLVQLRGVGASIDLVHTVYLPLGALSARLAGQVDRAMASEGAAAETIAEARRIAGATATLDADEEDRAAMNAARRQVEEIERAWAVFTSGADTPETRAIVREEIGHLATLVDARIAATSDKTARAQQAAERSAVALIGISLVLGVAVLVLVTRALRPIEGLTEEVRRVTAGGASDITPLPGTDELATLSRAFSRLLQALSERDRHLSTVSTNLRQVLDNIGAAVVVADGGAVHTANPSARTLWGLGEGDDLPPALAALGEGRHERRVGDRYEEVVVRPFAEVGRILVGEDTTARVRDVERLQRSERLALVGQMLAQVTHEVRNPLNAMSLNSEILADEVRSIEGRALLETITAEIRRLERVTERYLDLARRRPPEAVAEDPVALARNVLALEDPELRRQGVRASVDGTACEPVEIDGDAIRRALLNLVRNAAEAGAGTIRVRVRREPTLLLFEVEDDGPGLEPELAERVFEPFFTTRARGTGLGLAITRQTIEDLGGTVTVESTPGRGSVFAIAIPA